MNRWKKMKGVLSLGLAFAMAANTSVMADFTVPPPLGSGQTQQETTGNTGASQNGPGAGQTQNGGPGGGQTQAGTGTQTGTGTPSGGQAGAQTGSSSPSRLPAVTATVTTNQAGTNTAGSAQTGAAEKPVVQSQGAVLYDATHNQFLFEQNADTRYYPASITKLMTALIVLERANLDDTVTFSESAVTNLESGAVTLKAKAGDKLSVKDSMYGLLLKSANEIANGLAEHIAGSVSAFADLMNQKAASLGCTNTHFANPNGLNDVNHYTTARDMALIAKAAFENPTLCQIDSTINYDFPATSGAPTVRKLTMGHKMLDPSNTAYYYPGVVGGKTGYTSLAGNTLVTCAERDGVRLIAVVLKSKQSHYQDTKALLDYGFAFQKQNQSQVQTGPASGPGGAGASSSGGQGQAANGNTWSQDAAGWRFIKADGSYAKGECMVINNEYYYFKDDQYMVTGWHTIDGIWYFFRPSGGMAKSRWIETNGMWYYVDGNGSLFTGGTTPDGFTVDANGVWVK